MKILKKILLYILIFSFSATLLSGVVLPTSLFNWLLVMVSLAIAIVVHKPLLNFLTVKVNFMTFWIASSLLVVGALFALEVFVPGLEFISTTSKSLDLDVLTVNTFVLNKTMTMVFFAVIGSGIAAIFDVMNKKAV